MRFALSDEQRQFQRPLHRMLTAAHTPDVIRAWARGDHTPGLKLWARLAAADVFALEANRTAVELALALTEAGHHAVPGPLVETVAAAGLLARLAEAGEPAPAEAWLGRVRAGEVRVTLALPAGGPYALDADACDAILVVAPGSADTLRLAPGHGPVQPSLDPARRLARPAPGGEVVAEGPAVREAAAYAADLAVFAVAAQALGVGCALLERTVAYVRQRTQFGQEIGAFQAVKHRLADTLVGLEFARPLVSGAAVALASGAPGAPAEAAAAKAAACDAAYAAARTALQLHGAIGYTAEYDLSLWFGKARALRSAWGTPADCRARALDSAVFTGG
ncbi:acyl-CoA dehydrogenase family protein [Streptomyces sp. UNOC14_S4]|uniref:acyl-CoA dehydrogenase family protein n=1 Tax=Streptomyces sp. UNOC14_S4 TaxID=2872340 RepID=UPI001E387AF7|nr:acyl-CoA dehydrogenase family protein [Streptomyces sp. UNOC14_S4]MCC3770237.1 acyl-CoA dehydrogenase [Streptomyces sp. UNOC14_S4]